jgi:hypothetical protein
MKSYQEWVAIFSEKIMEANVGGFRPQAIILIKHIRDTCRDNVKRAALHNVLNTVGEGSK